MSDPAEAFDFRALDTLEACRECVELQKETWGEDFVDRVPASLLLVVHEAGGLVAGAFDSGDRLAGFVFSLVGRREGVPIHWSHMLAVRRDVRGRGLGRALKLHQRERVLADGIGSVWWTFDPLVAANAHLNFARLGAEAVHYAENLYGTETGSPLHGQSTDRLVLRWRLESPRTRSALAGRPPGRPREEALRLPTCPNPATPGEGPGTGAGPRNPGGASLKNRARSPTGIPES